MNRAIEAIAKGQDRVLLVIANGTGKTYSAFQIIRRFWKSRPNNRIHELEQELYQQPAH